MSDEFFKNQKITILTKNQFDFFKEGPGDIMISDICNTFIY